MTDSHTNIKLDTFQTEFTQLKHEHEKLLKFNKKLRKQNNEFKQLIELGALLNTIQEYDQVIDYLQSFLKSKFSIDDIFIILKQSNGSYTILGKNIDESITLPQNGKINDILKNDKPAYIDDIRIPNISTFNNTKLMCLPLNTLKQIGILCLFQKDRNKSIDLNTELYHLLTQIVASALDKISLFQKTKEMAFTDELTGIFNRRYFNQRYSVEMMRAKRYGRHLSVVMIDIDHFKKYNDTLGHIMGDHVLKQMVLMLKSNIRKADILCRYGGEEFVLLLPEITLNQAKYVAEKLRLTIFNTIFKGEDKLKQKVSISLGVASFPETGLSENSVLEQADSALYIAKKSGRNQVIIAKDY